MLTNDAIRIGLLRHGETAGGRGYCGRTDYPLSAFGWKQMWAAAEDGRWEGIVASPLRRCADFAREFAHRRALPLTIDARLQEMDFGAWEGRSAAELLETEPEALARFWENPWRHGPPGGEALPSLYDRVLAAWGHAVAQRRSVLLVTHGGPIRTIVCHVNRWPLEKLLHVEAPPGALRRFLVNGATDVRDLQML